jgi:hypothetical protein
VLTTIETDDFPIPSDRPSDRPKDPHPSDGPSDHQREVVVLQWKYPSSNLI